MDNPRAGTVLGDRQPDGQVPHSSLPCGSGCGVGAAEQAQGWPPLVRGAGPRGPVAPSSHAGKPCRPGHAQHGALQQPVGSRGRRPSPGHSGSTQAGVGTGWWPGGDNSSPKAHGPALCPGHTSTCPGVKKLLVKQTVTGQRCPQAGPVGCDRGLCEPESGDGPSMGGGPGCGCAPRRGGRSGGGEGGRAGTGWGPRAGWCRGPPGSSPRPPGPCSAWTWKHCSLGLG